MLRRKLTVLLALALVSVAAFMTLGVRGGWDFVLPYRGQKLAALTVVAVAVSFATILFQTICSNRILTPSVVGFDALYILLQSALVFFIGGLGYAYLPAEVKFGAELVALTGAALVLFGSLLGRGVPDLFRILLVGVVFGVLFRSLTNLLQRLIDPNEFAVLQGALFARFNSVDLTLLGISAALLACVTAIAWHKRHTYDVMALGRDQAVTLGLNHSREVFLALAMVSVLVATSTALVGPITFFGLLVSALTYRIMNTHHHGPLLIAASLLSITVLVGGQAIFERVLGMASTLSVVIEFVGGLVFLLLILKKARA